MRAWRRGLAVAAVAGAAAATSARAQEFSRFLACSGEFTAGGQRIPAHADFALRFNNRTALVQRSNVLPVGERLLDHAAMFWYFVNHELAEVRGPGASVLARHVDNDWLGVAPERPYQPRIYHSFNWRAWQDFSNGQLGDFGCHILDPVFMALKLTAPRTITAEAAPMNREIWYRKSKVRYEFPGTEHTAGSTVALTWYDGAGHLPPAAGLGLPSGFKLPGSGSILVGEKGMLLIPHVAMPKLLPEEKFTSFQIPVVPARDHYVSWALACLGEDKTTSHFDYSGPLTETVLLGTIAIRHPGATLKWNAESMDLTGAPGASQWLTKAYRKGWEPKWV